MPKIRSLKLPDVEWRVHKGKRTFIRAEKIVPQSHTQVFLSPRGQKAYHLLTEAEQRAIDRDITGGGSSVDHGVQIYFGHPRSKGDPAVHQQWSKARKSLSGAEKRQTKQLRDIRLRKVQWKYRVSRGKK